MPVSGPPPMCRSKASNYPRVQGLSGSSRQRPSRAIGARRRGSTPHRCSDSAHQPRRVRATGWRTKRSRPSFCSGSPVYPAVADASRSQIATGYSDSPAPPNPMWKTQRDRRDVRCATSGRAGRVPCEDDGRAVRPVPAAAPRPGTQPGRRGTRSVLVPLGFAAGQVGGDGARGQVIFLSW